MTEKVEKYDTGARLAARSTLITIRLTADEGRRLRAAAAADNRSAADYARLAAMDWTDEAGK